VRSVIRAARRDELTTENIAVRVPNQKLDGHRRTPALSWGPELPRLGV